MMRKRNFLNHIFLIFIFIWGTEEQEYEDFSFTFRYADYVRLVAVSSTNIKSPDLEEYSPFRSRDGRRKLCLSAQERAQIGKLYFHKYYVPSLLNFTSNLKEFLGIRCPTVPEMYIAYSDSSSSTSLLKVYMLKSSFPDVTTFELTDAGAPKLSRDGVLYASVIAPPMIFPAPTNVHPKSSPPIPNYDINHQIQPFVFELESVESTRYVSDYSYNYYRFHRFETMEGNDRLNLCLYARRHIGRIKSDFKVEESMANEPAMYSFNYLNWSETHLTIRCSLQPRRFYLRLPKSDLLGHKIKLIIEKPLENN